MADQPNNPWATPQADSAPSVPDAAPAASNPWGSGGGAADAATSSGGSDFLSQALPAPAHDAFSLWDPFKDSVIPLDVWVEHGLDWVVNNFRFIFQAVRTPIDTVLTGIETTLTWVAPPVMLVLIGLIAWQIAGRKMAIGAVLSMTFVGLIGAWNAAMVTLALVFTSVFFCVIVGLPTGIWLARNDRATQITRPILDAMQTTPAFVYLVPIVMLFGIGNVPGVVVTIIFALPPLIRLTNLGIRQVPEDLIEAAHSFGASNRQLLFKVQLPLAMPTIMAGVNQTLMLSLSMVVIASMIAVGGLGQMVLRGIGRLDMGLATIGGVGIVLLAIIIDRLTQALGVSKRDRGNLEWFETGPVGLLRRMLGKKPAA